MSRHFEAVKHDRQQWERDEYAWQQEKDIVGHLFGWLASVEDMEVRHAPEFGRPVAMQQLWLDRALLIGLTAVDGMPAETGRRT